MSKPQQSLINAVTGFLLRSTEDPPEVSNREQATLFGSIAEFVGDFGCRSEIRGVFCWTAGGSGVFELGLCPRPRSTPTSLANVS